jgi:oleate hydratase
VSLGNFFELQDDVVFIVEYFVRSAQKAVYTLPGLNREPSAVYEGQYDPRILHKAFTILHGIEV